MSEPEAWDYDIDDDESLSEEEPLGACRSFGETLYMPGTELCMFCEMSDECQEIYQNWMKDTAGGCRVPDTDPLFEDIECIEDSELWCSLFPVNRLNLVREQIIKEVNEHQQFIASWKAFSFTERCRIERKSGGGLSV